MKPLALGLAVIVFLAGCGSGVNTTSGGGTPSLVKVFRKQDGSSMYFAGPMHYTGKDGDLAMDFTINPSKEEPTVVVCNFTYTSTQNNSFKPDRLVLKSKGIESAPATSFELFFAEKKKKVYTYRYSCALEVPDWTVWMNADNHEIDLNGMLFEGGKKHKRHLAEVRDYILFPLSQN